MNNESWMSEEDRADLEKWIRFVTKAHEGQWRKGTGLPYIVHPMDVMSQLADWEIFCLKTWKVALGHDVREDCPHISPVQIAKVGGSDVAAHIEELSFFYDPRSEQLKRDQKAEYMKGWAKKHDNSGEYQKSVVSLVVKIGDRCCNVWDFLQTDPQYAGKYFKKGKPVFDAMVTRQDEITRVYGESVYTRMRHTHTELAKMLS